MKKSTRLLAALLALLLTLALGGCAANSKSSASYDMSTAETAAGYAYPEIAAEEAAESPAAMNSSDSTITTEAYDASGTEYQPSVSDFTAKIIYSADLSIQSTEFDLAVTALEGAITDFGGFIQSSNVYGNTVTESDGTTRVMDRTAYYTVRVPADKFEAFLKQAGSLGNVLSSSRNAENVTSAYTDYEARLGSLNVQEERLLAMLEKTEDVESLVALEERLADVRYEIESIQRNLRNLDMEISYSTVTIDLSEVEIYTPTAPVTRSFGQKMSDALSDGWNGFVKGLQSLCVGLASALPTLVLLAIVAVAAVLVLRRIRKNRRDKATAQKQENDKPE